MTDSSGSSFITFFLNNQMFGLEMRPVSEVLAIPEITVFGHSTQFDSSGVKGIFDLRGTIVPVIDLKVPLGLPSTPFSIANKVIVVAYNGMRFGLIVDSLGSALEVAMEQFSSAPEVDCGIPRTFIVGVARLEGGLIVILSVEEILKPTLGLFTAMEDARNAAIS